MTFEIDLSKLAPADEYSSHTLGLAMFSIGSERVEWSPGQLTARCKSLSGPDTWNPSATLEDGKVIGVTCNCPNGQRGGVRARCWHAAALEHLIEEAKNHDAS